MLHDSIQPLRCLQYLRTSTKTQIGRQKTAYFYIFLPMITMRKLNRIR